MTSPQLPERAALEAEHARLAPAARSRRSVDSFARAALEAFAWVIGSGVCGKLAWDSVRPPFFFYPLVLLTLYLLWDAVRSYRRARGELRDELVILRRLREVRVLLGIDPPSLGAVSPAGAAGPRT
ncbi:MAG: hypothetical protein NVSMB23_25140 [Myxococcales bacterium]